MGSHPPAAAVLLGKTPAPRNPARACNLPDTDRCFADVDPDAADPIQCVLDYGHTGPHKDQP